MAALQPSKSDPLGSAGGRALIRVAGWQLWVPRDSGLGWGISRRECSGGFVYFPKLLRRPEKQSPELPLAPPWSPPFPLRLPGTGVWAGPGCPFPFLQCLPGSVKLWGTCVSILWAWRWWRLGFFPQACPATLRVPRGRGLALLESNLLGGSHVELVWTFWSTVLWEATENSFQTMLGKEQFCFFFFLNVF